MQELLIASMTIAGEHQLLVGHYKNRLYICTCLGCGKFLGCVREFGTISVLDSAHRCEPMMGPAPESTKP